MSYFKAKYTLIWLKGTVKNVKKIEFIIRPQKLEDVKEALNKIGIRGMTVTQVAGCGLQKGKTEVYRGSTYVIDLIPKLRLEVVVKDDWLDEIIDVVCKAAKTGNVGDGKIFVSNIENAIRIRTGEEGEDAI
jgi:nitrogen regulatory protein P-II 1